MDIAIYKELVVSILIGLAAIIGAIARPYFGSFRQKAVEICHFRGDPATKLEQVHAWHSPDHHGEQGWRGHGLEQRLDALQQEHKEGRADFKEVLRRLDVLTEMARRQ